MRLSPWLLWVSIWILSTEMLKTKNVIAHMERLGHAGPRCLPEVKGLELAALTKQSPVESQYLCVSDTHCFTCLRHPRGDSPQTWQYKVHFVMTCRLEFSIFYDFFLCFWWWGGWEEWLFVVYRCGGPSGSPFWPPGCSWWGRHTCEKIM